MKIAKEVNYNNKNYKYLSDDFRENSSDTLYVQTKRNAHFVTSQHDIIQSNRLNDIFDIKPQVIGITGTNGKTSTAGIVYSLLLDMGYKVAMLGTRGFYMNDEQIKEKGLTTPDILSLYSYMDMAQECEFFVMEVSSHAIEQERISGIKFLIKAITNITQDHLDYHKTIEEYIRVKNSFLDDEKWGGISVINSDDKNIFGDRNSYYYGIENKINAKGSLYPNAYSIKTQITSHITYKCGRVTEDGVFDSNLVGRHNLYNLILGILIVKLATNKALEEICSFVANFGGVEGRAEIVSKEPLVVVDFAHTPDGFIKIFESFMGQDISVVFGAGGDRDKSKRPKMGEIAKKYAKKIYITSDNPRTEDMNEIIKEIYQGIDDTSNVTIEPNRKKAICDALDKLQKNEILLILGKGDETYQIIAEEKIHFDDREVVREYLQNKKS